MKVRSKNLLVTGGAGFIGSNFIDFFLDKYKNTNVINLDNLTYASNLNNTNSFVNNNNYKFVKGSICDKKLVQNIFDQYNIDSVINFAAESHVDNSIINPKIFFDTNINGVFNLLEICKLNWMNKPFLTKNKFKHARFHQVSTDEVYGSIDVGSFTEENKYMPNSPYSASKASADMIVRSYNKTFGLNTTISISSNNFGQHQNNEKFIPTVINSIINDNYIPVYGDGLNIRDWINVKDNCKAIELIFNKSLSGETYNIAGKNELTNLELIDIIYEIIKNSSIKYKSINKIKHTTMEELMTVKGINEKIAKSIIKQYK